MKKILFITAASVVLFVSSCQKEKVNPQNSQTSITLKQTFNYSQTLTIYDETGKYSADYIVQSDDKKVFENGINTFKGMKMNLLYENHVMTKNDTPESASENKKNIPAIDYSSTLFLKVENVNKGTAKGFELVPGPQLKGTYNENGNNSIIWTLPEFANWYKITNTGSNGFIARDLYSNNSDCSSAAQSSQVTLFYGQWHDFSATNTACRALWITTTTWGRYFQCTVSIY